MHRTILALTLCCAAAATAATVAPAPARAETPAAFSAAQIAAIRAGEPFGDAAAARAAGLPDPGWTLAHAEALGLSDGQRAGIAKIHAIMIDEAQELGAELLALEAQLEEAFRSGRASEGRIKVWTEKIGALRGALRFVHLRAHLQMRTQLTREQLDAAGALAAQG